jgi:hypothetical protein
MHAWETGLVKSLLQKAAGRRGRHRKAASVTHLGPETIRNFFFLLLAAYSRGCQEMYGKPLEAVRSAMNREFVKPQGRLQRNRREHPERLQLEQERRAKCPGWWSLSSGQNFTEGCKRRASGRDRLPNVKCVGGEG